MTRLANRVVLNSVFLSLALIAVGCGGESTPGSSGSGGKGGSGGSGSGGAGTGGQSGSGGVTGTGGTTGTGGVTGTGGQSGSGGGTGGGSGGSMDAAVDMPSTPEVAMEVRPEVPVSTGPMVLTSTAFTMGMEIPLMHKCANVTPRGMNISPPLSWTPGPAATKSYAITLNHVASNSAHWAIWDIPATVTSVAADIMHVAMPPMPAGSKQTMHNGFDGFTGYGYLGPCPQSVNMRQMYRYTVYAINVETLAGVNTGSTTTAAQAAIRNAAVPGAGSSASLVGTQIQN